MTAFLQHLTAALAAGAVFALLALGLSLGYRASGVVNLAQGELATLSAFVCVTLLDRGWRFWTAFAVTVVLSFAGGWAGERLLVRTVSSGLELGLPILTLGVLLATGGLETWIWGAGRRAPSSPFSPATVHVLGAALPKRELGVAGVALAAASLVLLALWRTRAGLAIRAAAVEPGLARGIGLNVEGMRALGWGLAAALGSVAGVLMATSHGLEPGMLRGGMVFALAGLVVGGLESPAGAVAGTLAVTVGVDLLGDYVHWVGAGLRVPAAAAVLLVVLLVRPLRRTAPA